MNSTESVANIRKPINTFGQVRLDELFGQFVFVLMLVSLAFTPFRYLNYLIPMLALLVLLANRKIHAPDLARPYLVIVLASLVLSPFANGEGVKDIYLILTGLSMALVGFRKVWSWWWIFSACAIGFAFSLFIQGAFSGWSTLVSNFTFDFSASRSTFESGFSYLFGLLAVWAAYTKRWRRFALAFFFAFLTLKRIVIVGIVLCAMLQFLPRPVLLKILSPIPMMMANAVFLFLILSYGSGKFDLLIHDLTSQSANALGMGRRVLYSFIVSDFFKEPWRFLLIGSGPGDAYEIMKGGWSWLRKENLHGDTLKILYEYGGLVLALFVWALYSSRRPAVLLLALYSNILLLTDNTLIYPFYIYFATLMAASIVSSEDADTHIQGADR